MMKKLFIKLSMLLFVLSVGTNIAWATGALSSTPMYSATLTANVSSTGGGKVYVTEDDVPPSEELYDETGSATKGLVLSMQGMDNLRVAFWAWQMANDGYYFAGWSYADNGFDLGKGGEEYNNYSALYDVSMEKADYDVDEQGNPIPETLKLNPEQYTIYATFEPVRIAGYEISGANTITEGTSCTQTVTFELNGEDIDANDFYAPAITSSTGGGDWTNASGEPMSISDLNISGTTATVVVKFTAPNAEVAEYSATLQLKTKADITMNVLLGARIIADGVEAIRLNKSKVQQETGALTEMLGHAEAGDIVKLNGDYNKAVSINKTITFDLNGYELSNTLTVAGGNVTIAYSPYGGSANALSVAGGKAILNGGTFGSLTVGASGTVEQNGATITGAAENNGTLTTYDGIFEGGLTSAGTLTVNGGTFDGEIAIKVTGGTAQIKKGTISGSTYGVQTNGGSATIEKLAVIRGNTKALNSVSGALTVNGGKFTDPANLNSGSITFNAGYFQTNNAEATEVLGKHVWRNTSGAEFREGYEFFAGTAEAAKAAGVSVCHIGGTSYAALEDALAYANNTSDKAIIIMDNDYTMPAGYYTLPENAALIIPKSNEQGNETKTVDRVIFYQHEYVTPSKFRCLTLSNGVNLDVHGTIEVSGTQYSSYEEFASSVYGPYGQLQMNQGSTITLQDGSELRAWGFVTGDIDSQDAQRNVPMGEIDARRGSMVREQFQMGDWKGARFSGMGLLEGNTVFPLNTYFIQNIEVPVKYHPGASLSTAAGVTAAENEWGSMGTTVSNLLGSANISMSANDIRIIGVTADDEEKSMFMMDAAADAENTWVRKWYDASKDQQVYEINSGAHIGCLIIPLVSSPLFPKYLDDRFPEDLTMNSGQYFLPITNNFKLHLLSGTMDFTQSTELLPGSEVEIDKEGTALISADDPDDDIRGGYLFVYDIAEWGNYAGGVPARRVKYSPVFEGEPNTRGITLEDMQSASINVHGTFDSYGGQVYVSESGANIFSSVEDAGTYLFSEDATNDTIEVNQVTTSTGTGQLSNNFVSVKLKNAAGVTPEYTASYVDEQQYAKADDAYCYLDIDGTGAKWTSLVQVGCFMYDEAHDIYYAKPQDYVAVAVTVTEDKELEKTIIEGNNDHTYSDLAGAGRLFILLTNEDGYDCQWWEVEAKENYFHCIHPENDTYYEWDNINKKWKEKKFTITWKDKNWGVDDAADKVLATYQVPYGTQAEWLSTNPTRPASIDYTYDFTGWTPALGPVTSDVTYTATYEPKQIKYTITFVNDGGVEIERHLLARNEMPVCENVPTRTGYTLEWSPALAAVTGNQTYTATWLPEPPTEYEIKFMDYDGTTKLKPTGEEPYMVAVGTVPTPPANPAGKPATPEFTYVFDHWSPALEEVSATSAKVYTAVYREVAREYTIYYFKEDGVTPNATKASESLPYGATPTPPTVSKEDPENGHTYTLIWKNLAKTATIQTVTGSASYKPTYLDAINKYTVSVRSNPAGACVITGNGIYEYDEDDKAVEISLDYDDEEYEFVGWSDDMDNIENPRTMAVTSDITLVANFEYIGKEATVTITWMNGDNLLLSNNQLEETPTIYTGATPTKPASAESTFTFDGWATTKDGDLAYKKGQTPWATEDATYYAHFAATPATYTISWMNEAGTSAIEVDYDQPYGETTVFNGAAPTKQATAAATFTFDGWAAEANGEKVYNIGATPAVSGAASYYAHFAATPKTYTVTWKRDDGSLLGSTEVAYGVTPSYEGTPTKPATPQYSYTFEAWDRAFEPVEGLTTYTASFTSTPNTHTVTWLDGDGNTLDTDVLAYGATPSYDGATPTKSPSALYIYTFNGTWSPSIVPVNGDATYTAQFDEAPNPESNLEIGIGESEDLNNEVVERTNLIISSNGVASGELLGAGNLTITGDAIFRLEKTFNAGEWYAVAVPWAVNPSTGIYAGSSPLSLGSQFYVIEFDAAAYAEGSTNTYDYWTFLHQTGVDMVPGKLYMIYLSSGQTALDFHKKEGAAISTTQTSVAITGGDDSRANWNAIANPALYYANLSTGATDVQFFNNGGYTPGNTTSMIVGQPAFAQVSTPGVVEATPVGGGTPAPYRRAQQANDADTRFEVEIARDGKMNDRIIIQTTDEKENKYVIGKDLVKFGISSTVAQMWMNRYDENLCKNTIELVNGVAEYPLSIFAPASGEYQISNVKSQISNDVEYELYLTLNGQAIWNLSDGAYTLNLDKGTVSNYGLRVSARAPQTPTGVDEAIVDAQGDTRKVLIGNQVFIIRGDKVYGVDGRLVK